MSVNINKFEALFLDTETGLLAHAFDLSADKNIGTRKISLLSVSTPDKVVRRSLKQCDFRSIWFDVASVWSLATRAAALVSPLTLDEVKFLDCTFHSNQLFSRIRFVDVIFSGCEWNQNSFVDCTFVRCSFSSNPRHAGDSLNVRFVDCEFSQELKLSRMDASAAEFVNCHADKNFKLWQASAVAEASGGILPSGLSVLLGAGSSTPRDNPYANVSRSSGIASEGGSNSASEIYGGTSRLSTTEKGSADKKSDDSKLCCDGIDLSPLVARPIPVASMSRLRNNESANTARFFDGIIETRRQALATNKRAASFYNIALGVTLAYVALNFVVLCFQSLNLSLHFATDSLAKVQETVIAFHEAFQDAVNDEAKNRHAQLNQFAVAERNEIFTLLKTEAEPTVAAELVKRLPSALNEHPRVLQSSQSVATSGSGTNANFLGSLGATVAPNGAVQPSSAVSRRLDNNQYSESSRIFLEVLDRGVAMAQSNSSNITYMRIEIGVMLFLLTVLANRYFVRTAELLAEASQDWARFSAAEYTINLSFESGDHGVFAKTLLDLNKNFMPPRNAAASGTEDSGTTDKLIKKMGGLIFGKS